MIAHEMPGDHRSDLDRASEPASAGTSSPNHPGKAGGDGVMVQRIGGCVSVTEGATWIGSVTSALSCRSLPLTLQARLTLAVRLTEQASPREA